MGAVLFSPLSAVQAGAGEQGDNATVKVSCDQMDQEVGDKG